MGVTIGAPSRARATAEIGVGRTRREGGMALPDAVWAKIAKAW
jgi:hypothetical protein